jgi:hypothetical protein
LILVGSGNWEVTKSNRRSAARQDEKAWGIEACGLPANRGFYEDISQGLKVLERRLLTTTTWDIEGTKWQGKWLEVFEQMEDAGCLLRGNFGGTTTPTGTGGWG